MSLVDDVHGEVTAMRGVLASGLPLVTGAYEHAGRIVVDLNQIGFLGVGARCLRIQQTIAEIRATMASAANQLTDARATIGTASGQPTPQQLIDALTPVQATITAVRDALSGAIAQVDHAHQEITEALRGAKPGPMRARLEAIRATLADVVSRCQTTDRQITAAIAQARQAGNLGGIGGAPGEAAGPTAPPPAFDPTPYLDEMPKRAPRMPGQPAQKTHGWLIRADGTAEELISSESGPDYDLARERAWEARVAPRPWGFSQASHVEIKIASRMYDAWRKTEQVQHETIVINNRPCAKLPLDCEFVIERFLPPGSTLSVYGPDGFKKTYRGKDTGS